ncbi:MAG: HD domain-containing protein [SAR202 cluster bacterium]|nr:HD domain-containing protein [SAR202 cluster bacterium]|tara:strand:+ start:30696 stop:32207 length:1512 start_codon:yes stop_codon:yes gene_type:complete
MSSVSIPKSPELNFDNQIIQFLEPIRDFFSSENVSAYIVGGFLRDSLMGRYSFDIDIAIDHDPIEIGNKLTELIGGKCIVLDHDRKIVRMVLPTCQTNLSLLPKHIDLSFVSNGIRDDLSHRDFTIDAIALPFSTISNPSNGDLIDIYGGLSDISCQVLRVVSGQSLTEDPVRLVRAVRLSAQLGFSLDEFTEHSISKNSHLITSVSTERVREEFLKIFEQKNISNSLRIMDDTGLLCKIIPELDTTKGSMQPKEHYWDVFNHCLQTPGKLEKIVDSPDDQIFSLVPRLFDMYEYFSEIVSDGHNRLTMAKVAGLLHDIAKPATKTVDGTGRIRFIGHDLKGSEVTESFLDRLRFSNKGKNHISTMVRHHLRPTQMSSDGQYPTDKAMYRYYRDLKDVAFDILFLNLADYLAAKEDMLEMDDWRSHCGLIDFIMKKGLDILAVDNQVRQDRLIDGYGLMKILGIGPGETIGVLLEQLEESHKLGEITTRKEAILLARTLFARL